MRWKLAFFKTAMLTVLLYGAESWPISKQQLYRLEVFHQRRLREILRIRWTYGVSTAEALRLAKIPPIAARRPACQLGFRV